MEGPLLPLVAVLDPDGLDEEAEEVCVLLDGFRCGFSCPVSSVSVHPDQEWSRLKIVGLVSRQYISECL